MHEASLHTFNSFVTLTVDDQHLFRPFHLGWYPDGRKLWSGSLDGPTADKPGAFALFMKRLRKRLDAGAVRYYHAGEYGETYGRPHYHACLFGVDFFDKEKYTTRQGVPLFRSSTLESLWPFGQAVIGAVTFESAAYVARYIMKKLKGGDPDAKAAHYQTVDRSTGVVDSREAEYCTMSRRPGIARGWFERYGDEVYPDGVVVRGHLAKPPRYYDSLYELDNPVEFGKVRRRRIRAIREEENTRERIDAREKCAIARLETFSKRGVE